MECGASSPLLFSLHQTKSGEDAPHSIRSAISITILTIYCCVGHT
jgi:hypothetical protein